MEHSEDSTLPETNTSFSPTDSSGFLFFAVYSTSKGLSTTSGFAVGEAVRLGTK